MYILEHKTRLQMLVEGTTTPENRSEEIFYYAYTKGLLGETAFETFLTMNQFGQLDADDFAIFLYGSHVGYGTYELLSDQTEGEVMN